jgi:type II secretory pathway component GspD/PulD (secretin)
LCGRFFSFGIDLSASGNVAYRFLESATLDGLESGINANVLLNGLVKASNTSDSVSIVSQPLFVMRDGSDFTFENTDNIPYVKRIATEEGFISDSEVVFISTGLKIKVTLRELGEGALLSLDIKNDTIIEINEESGLPRTNGTAVSSETPLSSTGIYLLAQSDYTENSYSYKTFGKSQKVKKSTLQIFARVFKIDNRFKGLVTDK